MQLGKSIKIKNYPIIALKFKVSVFFIGNFEFSNLINLLHRYIYTFMTFTLKSFNK